MVISFKIATKKAAKLRAALIGPSGSGKTYTALAIASALAPDGKIAVLDTERGSASLYAGDPFEFMVAELHGNYHPQNYIDAIVAAEKAGIDVLIIDSLSHEWNGPGGCLELVDKASVRSSGNSWAAWKDVTPLHNALLDTINAANMHIIATMRAKTQYVIQTNDKGKNEPVKLGMGAVQRDGAEYEFGVIGELDLDHNLVITKTRCQQLADTVWPKAGADVAGILAAWLGNGDMEEATSAAEVAARAKSAQARQLDKTEIRQLYDFAKSLGMQHQNVFEALGVDNIAKFLDPTPLQTGKDLCSDWLRDQIINAEAEAQDTEAEQPELLDIPVGQHDQYSENS